MANPQQQLLGGLTTRLAARLNSAKVMALLEQAQLSEAANGSILAQDGPGKLGVGQTFFYELRQARGQQWMTVGNVRPLFDAAGLVGDFDAVVGATPAPPSAAPVPMPASAAAATPTSTATTATTTTNARYQSWQSQHVDVKLPPAGPAATPPVMGTEAQVGEWYATDSREVVPAVEMPHVAATDSTMTGSLHEYVKKKFALPDGEKDFAMELARIPEVQLKVVGVWEDHFPKFCRLHGWHLLRRPVASQAGTGAKRFYAIRPSLVVVDLLDERDYPRGTPFYVLLVTPGRDYLLQYGHMLRLLVGWHRGAAIDAEQIEVWHYQRAAKALGIITAFSEVPRPVLTGATVILGYVEKFAANFAERHQAVLDAQQTDGEFVMTANKQYGYRSFIVKRPSGSGVVAGASGRGGNKVVLLGVRHPYWGDIAGTVALLVAAAGAKCILYAAKCGTMSHDIKIYETPIIPSQYAELEPVVDPATNSLRGDYRPVWDWNNVLARLWPSRLTGFHVSVPTVTGETFSLLEGSGGRGCTSIDNELGRMAAAVKDAPAAADGTHVSFGSVHFATDHVRNEREALLRTSHDLSNQSKEKRDAVLRVIGDLLAEAVIALAPRNDS